MCAFQSRKIFQGGTFNVTLMEYDQGLFDKNDRLDVVRNCQISVGGVGGCKQQYFREKLYDGFL